MPDNGGMTTRLNKFIAETGFCSRREADRLLAERRVTVNGMTAGTGAVVGEGDEVLVDGQPLKVRLSPLLDPFLVSSYQESARVAQELKLVRGKPEIKGWFDDRYLKAALKAQKLENHWPAYGPNGQLLAR